MTQAASWSYPEESYVYGVFDLQYSCVFKVGHVGSTVIILIPMKLREHSRVNTAAYTQINLVLDESLDSIGGLAIANYNDKYKWSINNYPEKGKRVIDFHAYQPGEILSNTIYHT